MTDTHPSQYPNSQSQVSPHLFIEASIPAGLDLALHDYLEEQEYVNWEPHKGAHNHSNMQDYAAVHTLNFIGQVARNVKREVETRITTPVRILPGSTAINGLRRYYDELCYHPARRQQLYDTHTEYLAHHAGRVVDVHVTAALRQQLRVRAPFFKSETIDAITSEIIPDIFVAQSLAMQSLPATPRIPEQRRRIIKPVVTDE